MSDILVLPAAIAITVFQENLVQDYVSMAINVLVMYDYVLNIGDEALSIWSRKSASSLLLFLNRLTLMAFVIINFLMFFPYDNGLSCMAMSCTNVIVYLMSVCISSVVAALRVHALSRSNWWLVIPTLALGLVPVGTNAFTYSRIISYPLIAFGSSSGTFIATRGALLASDILVVIVTWWYLSRLILPAFEGSRILKSTLSRVMLEDGTLYFVVLTVLNITDVVVFMITSRNQDLSSSISPISSVLTSHFLLHIRKAADRNVDIGTQTPSFVRPDDIVPTRSWISSIEFTPNVAVSSSEQDVDEGDTVAQCVDGEGYVSMVDGHIRDEEGQERVVEVEVLGEGVHHTDRSAAV